MILYTTVQKILIGKVFNMLERSLWNTLQKGPIVN